MNKRHTLTAFAMLVVAALACNRTVPTPTPGAPTPVVGPDSTATISPSDGTPVVSTSVPPSGVTPSPTGTTPAPGTPTPTESTPECTYDADFVTDVTIPDDTELEPGAAFVKTWRLRNSGTCAWEAGTVWVFDSGDKMDGPDSAYVPTTEAGNTTDITVQLTAPATPGEYSGYWVIRRPNGEDLGTSAYVRIVVVSDEVTPTPTATPTLTPTGEAAAGPGIDFFRSDVEEADPGDTITLEWQSTGATSATLYHLMPTGQLGSFWEVGVNGVFDYEIGESERNRTAFLLTIQDDQERTSQATLFIALRCPDTWFFEPPPEECPASSAVVSDGAEQRFEHGTMIWVREEDLVYVLYDDEHYPKWHVFSDEWDEGEPESDPNLTPPAGLYQPVRGFGLIWREQPSVRDRLQWAIDTEHAFNTAVQRTSRPKYNDIYIGGLDTTAWKLLYGGSAWEKIP